MQPVTVTEGTALLLLAACGCVFSTCQAPFSVINGACLLIDLSERMRWCQAAAKCQAIGGELPNRPETLLAMRANLSTGDNVFAGVTDVLEERSRSPVGWWATDGTLFPESGWGYSRPDDAVASDDFVVATRNGMHDTRFTNVAAVACQPIVTPNARTFARTEFLRPGEASPQYCYSDAAADTLIHCLDLCGNRWECRAALYNSALRQCRMLDFTDASVDDEIESSPDWVKFVKKLY